MAEVVVRRDIWTLEESGPWHPIARAYARAVGVLKQRDPALPVSWAYQAAVHGVPFGEAGDRFRGQCQHNSWYFLPWHRMYLYWFERIVRGALAGLEDVPADVRESWALPYWNYDRGGATATLPPAFREPTLEDGVTPNPLFEELRADFIKAGEALFPEETSPALALREPFFSPSGLANGFGGPVTAWHHGDETSAAPGELESTPHNVVHGAVGGPGGLMSGFDTAPLDPVFWLHHANIDRLWTVWLNQVDRANPSESDWTGFRFDFHDEQGTPVQQAATDVLDTEAALGYTYQDVAPPLAPERRRGRRPMPTEPPPDHPPELVSATEERLELTGEPARVQMPVAAPSGPLRRRGAAAAPERVYLNVEGIQGKANPGISYGVYLNLPDDDDPDTDPERHHVGNVSFFGIELASDVRRDHPGGHGLRYTFDITDTVRELRESGRWDPAQLTVTLSPLRGAGPEAPPVTVGRIELYYQ